MCVLYSAPHLWFPTAAGGDTIFATWFGVRRINEDREKTSQPRMPSILNYHRAIIVPILHPPTHLCQANPEQSKHLETARMKIAGVWVDLVNLRTEVYRRASLFTPRVFALSVVQSTSGGVTRPRLLCIGCTGRRCLKGNPEFVVVEHLAAAAATLGALVASRRWFGVPAPPSTVRIARCPQDHCSTRHPPARVFFGAIPWDTC